MEFLAKKVDFMEFILSKRQGSIADNIFGFMADKKVIWAIISGINISCFLPVTGLTAHIGINRMATNNENVAKKVCLFIR